MASTINTHEYNEEQQNSMRDIEISEEQLQKEITDREKINNKIQEEKARSKEEDMSKLDDLMKKLNGEEGNNTEKNNEIANEEKNYNEFLQNNPDIKNKIENGEFQFLEKDVAELYKEGVKSTIEGKPEAEHETLIFDFNTRFKSSLDFVGGKECVNFLDKTGARKTGGTINQYGESLLGGNIEEWTTTKTAFFNKLKASMFYQHLDNPLKYCSHGADHSILVDRYVQNIIESYPDVVTSVENKYGIDKEGAKKLLRLTAVFHDFGYPDIKGLAKSMHGPFGGAHFINEYASEEKSTFTEYIKNDLGIKEEEKVNQIITDMRDAIFFHSADKVEKGYLNKIKYKKGSFLIGKDLTAKGTEDFMDILIRESDGFMTITYRSEEGKENAENFKKMILEKTQGQGITSDQIIIEEDSQKTYDYDEEFGSKSEYQGRKGKVGDTGIEFQPIDLNDEPLAGIVRLADNMDMSFDRLKEIQSNPIFMNIFYNIGYKHLENGETDKESTSYIYQKMEKLNSLDKKKQISKEEYDNKNDKDKKDYITPEDYKQKYSEISNEIEELINKANGNGGLKMTIFNERTGKPKEGESTFRTRFDKSILKADGKVDLNTYKLFIIDEVAKHEGLEDDQQIKVIKNIAIDDDIGSYSFRHFVGLTPIKDVTIESNNETGKKTLVVKVNKDIYLEPELRNQKITEGSFINRPVVEYHIWRLFDASGRVTVNKGLLELKIIDENTRETIGEASRTSAKDNLNIKYTVDTPDEKADTQSPSDIQNLNG